MLKQIKGKLNAAYGKFANSEGDSEIPNTFYPTEFNTVILDVDVTNGHEAVLSEYVKPKHILS